MATDRVFREEDAIWWDAHVRSPRRYSFKEMNEEYEGLAPFSNSGAIIDPREPKHIYVVDPEAQHLVGVDIRWSHVGALVIVMVAVVAVVAILAAAAVAVLVPIGVLSAILAIAFARTSP